MELLEFVGNVDEERVFRVSYLGEEAVRVDPEEHSSLRARAVVQSEDLDFSYYYLDCGVMD